MLSGEPPFDGDSSASILAKQITQAPAPIRRSRSDVPEELAFVLERMLQKNPARRLQTAAELSRALVDALPTAARDRVRVPLRRRLRAMAFKSLVGLGVAGCLAFVAFVAGAAVVAYTVFSKKPKIIATEPIPDSLARALRERRALAAGEIAEYAFQPGGPEDTTLLLVTRRRLVVLTPRQVRSYPRDSVRVRLDLDFRGGFFFRLVARRGAVPTPCTAPCLSGLPHAGAAARKNRRNAGRSPRAARPRRRARPPALLAAPRSCFARRQAPQAGRVHTGKITRRRDHHPHAVRAADADPDGEGAAPQTTIGVEPRQHGDRQPGAGALPRQSECIAYHRIRGDPRVQR